ncbi:MAG: bifunctional transcriptional activator/DNA repair enzyme AdaA, partial [Chloroflexota bacterium]
MDEARYWQAVLERDASFDMTFVYAVRTTGIYCRPSCSSRRAKREHVVFFQTPASAEQAQFRACLRCHPHKTTRDDQGLALVQQVCQLLEEATDKPPTLAELSAAVHISPFHLQRTFKRVMGITPRQYADACRVDRFKDQLRKGSAVTHALYDAGYGSSSRVYEQAVEQLGMTPTTYRKRGKGMHIHYTIVDCQLGRLLVAATERG